jgi:hypothetical protein
MASPEDQWTGIKLRMKACFAAHLDTRLGAPQRIHDNCPFGQCHFRKTGSLWEAAIKRRERESGQ